MKVAAIIKLIRVTHWIKNGFIFLPAFFAVRLGDPEALLNCIIGFFCFSLVASTIYVFNDLMDIEKDRLHPKKKNRPLASGVLSKKAAYIIIASFLVATSLLIAQLPVYFIFVLGLYFVMNFSYSLGLKSVAILDISIIAIGFLLRVIAGGILADVEISKWIIIMTFLLAMFIALAKRRDDVLLMEKTGTSMRKSLDGYNRMFINMSMIFMSSITVVAYITYTVSPEVIDRIGNDYVYGTSFFVILGILRYLQITMVEERSGSPTELVFKDLALKLILAAWGITFFILLYLL